MMNSKGIFNMKDIDYDILFNSLAIAQYRNQFVSGLNYLFANVYFNNIEKDGEIKSERELGFLTKKQKFSTAIKIDGNISFELYSILKDADNIDHLYIFIDDEFCSRIRRGLYSILKEIRSTKEDNHGIKIYRLTYIKLGYAISRMSAVRFKIKSIKNMIRESQ